ncbi:MAG: DUF1667 domain-containing protein [Acholeplasma sp.]|jgi:CxxC motif-containing protein|nr:DUF1667 domain-containing protein [Acholeplasma sp.]
MKELTCIVCPVGCHLSVDDDLNVTGNRCPRGKTYGFLEMTNPTRMMTTTVKTAFVELPRLSVKSSSPIPKALIFEAKALLDGIIIKNHVKIGDVVLPNILGTGIDIVSTKSI